MKEILKEGVKEELTRVILSKIVGDENEWNEYDIAPGIIKNLVKPKLSTDQVKKWRELRKETAHNNQLRLRRGQWRCGIL